MISCSQENETTSKTSNRKKLSQFFCNKTRFLSRSVFKMNYLSRLILSSHETQMIFKRYNFSGCPAPLSPSNLAQATDCSTIHRDVRRTWQGCTRLQGWGFSADRPWGVFSLLRLSKCRPRSSRRSPPQEFPCYPRQGARDYCLASSDRGTLKGIVPLALMEGTWPEESVTSNPNRGRSFWPPWKVGPTSCGS